MYRTLPFDIDVTQYGKTVHFKTGERVDVDKWPKIKKALEGLGNVRLRSPRDKMVREVVSK